MSLHTWDTLPRLSLSHLYSLVTHNSNPQRNANATRHRHATSATTDSATHAPPLRRSSSAPSSDPYSHWPSSRVAVPNICTAKRTGRRKQRPQPSRDSSRDRDSITQTIRSMPTNNSRRKTEAVATTAFSPKHTDARRKHPACHRWPLCSSSLSASPLVHFLFPSFVLLSPDEGMQKPLASFFETFPVL